MYKKFTFLTAIFLTAATLTAKAKPLAEQVSEEIRSTIIQQGAHSDDLSLEMQLSQKVVNIDLKNSTYEEILKEIKNQTSIGFVVKGDISSLGRTDFKVRNSSAQDALTQLFQDTGYTYAIHGNTISITPITTARAAQQKPIEIKGKVVDENGDPVLGATVISTSGVGTITDGKGVFTLTLPKSEDIEVSCLGYVTITKTIKASSNELEIAMEKDEMAVEDVVVTGYADRNKNTFTGSVTVVKGDDLRKISTTNLFNALSVVDPAIRVEKSNEQGSNPNYIPDIVIRGTSSLNATNEQGLNAPLIVIDGVEADLKALYDMDIFDIEAVTVLKDASATSLYGEQAANGVILVTRKRSTDKKLRLTYNLSANLQAPDLSSYQLMNAAQKLDFERISGMYDDKTGSKYENYVNVLKRVNSGIDTDWISKPVRSSLSHSHSINLSGAGSGLYYSLSARYNSINGVMKEDNRNNSGVGLSMSYSLKNKLSISLRADYSQTYMLASKYGSFQDYANANPYDAPYDAYGDYVTLLSHALINPLYEASLSSFSDSKTNALSTSLNLRWNLKPGLYIIGSGSLTSGSSRSDRFVSPNSGNYSGQTDPAKKGSYTITDNTSSSYLVKLSGNYNIKLDTKGSLITFYLGAEARRNAYNPYSFTTMGFFNDKLTDPTFGSGYPSGSKPSGTSSESASVGAFASTNIVYRNRYFADLSYRTSGSSAFGKDQRYAPFWSAGLGWNMHNEEFMKNIEWLEMARLRASYGYTGSIDFASYQAITTYRYSSSLVNKYGIGAVPITMGNDDLKWQTTKSFNIGLSTSLFEDAVDFNVDYYSSRTVDMVVPISMPPSSGVTETTSNLGEQLNQGFEFGVSSEIIDTDDLNLRLSANASRNVNKLLKISNGLKNLNDDNMLDNTGSSPMNMFVEGESSTMIYAVRSAGIDPASGREIFIDKYGVATYEYDPKNKVAIGDASAWVSGSVSANLMYKNLYIGLSFQYSLGGYVYNSSRAGRIEQVVPKYNADVRAYTDRWKKPGDIVEYVAIDPVNNGEIKNVYTSRFVEKENYLNLSYISVGYELNTPSLSKYGLKRLNFSVSMSDIANFSTIEQERGTAYPFARGVSFTISPTF